MREPGGFEHFVVFKDDDCTVKQGADTVAMLASLAVDPGIADMKLMPLP